MKTAFYFMLGTALVILTSATTVSVMTVKPAKPKGTIVFTTDYGRISVKEAINNYIRQGYIVKSVAGSPEYGGNWIVVMEKY